MTNRTENPSYYEGFIPGAIKVGGNTTTQNVLMDLPGGHESMVAVRIGNEEAPDAAAKRENFYLTVYPPNLTEGLEREVARLTEQFAEITHFDRNGEPVYRFTGRERNVLEMKLANRRNALVIARRDRAFAEGKQAQARAAKQAEEARIEAGARAKAQQLIEQAEIDRRAKQIAARAGVTSE